MAYKYGNADLEAGNSAKAVYVNGSEVKAVLVSIAVANGDGNGSVYRVLPNISSDAIIFDIQVENSALGTGASADLGLYKAGANTAIDDDALTAAQSMVSAGSFDGMKSVSLTDKHKPVYELAGHDIDSRNAAYDLCLTMDNIGASSGNVLVRVLIANNN